MVKSNDLGGVWRTIGGRRIFIKDGQELASAMKESGKFKTSNKNQEYSKLEDFKSLEKYKNMTSEELYEKAPLYGEDKILEDINKERGFDGKPTQLSNKELDDKIKDGGTEVFRIISSNNEKSASDFVNEFKNGDFYVSNGVHGSGCYTSASKETASRFAKKGKDTEIMRMVIDKDAKIKTFENIFDRNKQLDNDVKSYSGAEKIIVENTGRSLAIKGYDAYYIKSQNYYVILNRSKIYVEK